MCWNDQVKAAVRERRILGRIYWELDMKVQKKGVWNFTQRKIERLKGAFNKVRRRSKNSLEDESRCQWK